MPNKLRHDSTPPKSTREHYKRATKKDVEKNKKDRRTNLFLKKLKSDKISNFFTRHLSEKDTTDNDTNIDIFISARDPSVLMQRLSLIITNFEGNRTNGQIALDRFQYSELMNKN